MPKPYKRENGTYRVQFRVNGVKHDKAFDTYEEAQAYIDNETDAATSKGFAQFVERRYRPSPTFTEMDDNSRLAYNQALGHLTAYYGSTPLDKIGPASFKAYRTHRNQQITRRGAPPGGATINLERAVLIGVMAEALELKLIDSIPMRESRRIKTESSTEWTSTEDRANLFFASQGSIDVIRTPSSRLAPKDKKNPKAPRARIYPKAQPPCKPPPYLRMACRFLLIQFEFASRGGEISDLKLADINLLERTVRMRNTKNGKDVTKPMSTLATLLTRQQMDFLDGLKPKWPNPLGLLFPSRNGTPLDFGYQATQAREYGLTPKHYRTHMNRAGFVTKAFQKNASLDDVKNITKHMSEARLREYRKMADMTDEERERVDDLSNTMVTELLNAAKFKNAVYLGESATDAVRVLEDLVSRSAEDAELAAMDAAFAKNPVEPVAAPTGAGPKKFRSPFDAIKAAIAEGKLTFREAVARLMPDDK